MENGEAHPELAEGNDPASSKVVEEEVEEEEVEEVENGDNKGKEEDESNKQQEEVDKELEAMMAEVKTKKKSKKKDKGKEKEKEKDSVKDGEKKKSKKKEKSDKSEKSKSRGEESTSTTNSKDLYPYSELLALVYDKLRANNPDLVQRTTARLKPPQVMRSGTSKILWVNFPDICQTMNREPEHVFRFFLAELGTTGSIDGSGRFMIKGKYVSKTIESLLRKYIKLYVSCASCNNVNTKLVKDPVTRMNFMHCATCGASRSVEAISQGFHATQKGERRAARNTG